MTLPVTCATHGALRAALVCQHSVHTLRDEVARGAYWCREGCFGRIASINGFSELD